MFGRIHDAVVNHDVFFHERSDALGKGGLSSVEKLTTALRLFAYGTVHDYVDEYIGIGESTAMKCFYRLASAVTEIFGEEYLRKLTAVDVLRNMEVFENLLRNVDFQECLDQWIALTGDGKTVPWVGEVSTSIGWEKEFGHGSDCDKRICGYGTHS